MTRRGPPWAKTLCGGTILPHATPKLATRENWMESSEKSSHEYTLLDFLQLSLESSSQRHLGDGMLRNESEQLKRLSSDLEGIVSFQMSSSDESDHSLPLETFT